MVTQSLTSYNQEILVGKKETVQYVLEVVMKGHLIDRIESYNSVTIHDGDLWSSGSSKGKGLWQ